jgi:hypothetical protein
MHCLPRQFLVVQFDQLGVALRQTISTVLSADTPLIPPFLFSNLTSFSIEVELQMHSCLHAGSVDNAISASSLNLT